MAYQDIVMPQSRTRTATQSRALTQLERTGNRLVHGFQEKGSWFLRNIVMRHPNVKVRVRAEQGPTASVRRRNSRKLSSRQSDANVTQERILNASRSDISASPSIRVNLPRVLRSSRRIERNSCQKFIASQKMLGDDEQDEESECEDFGQLCSVTNEDSSRSGFSQYHSALSHISDLNEAMATISLPTVNEDPDVDLKHIHEASKGEMLAVGGTSMRLSSESPPASGHFTQTHESFGLLSRTTPSILLTLPTPKISHSPIFRPRSPITLAKYAQATSSQLDSPAHSVSVTSLSPVPSIPSCDQCCLAQLEDGLICRSCETQWLACKMWYQANDGGRRRWLTEPFILPAESNANIRAVMDILGVPGSTEPVGLGLSNSPVAFKKELPFKVVATSPDMIPLCCNRRTCTGVGRWSSNTARLRHFHKTSLDVTRTTRDTLRAWLSDILTMWTCPRISWFSGGLFFPDASLSWPCDSSKTSLAGTIVPYCTNHLSRTSPSLSFGSSASGLECITSSSRFVEHLVVG